MTRFALTIEFDGGPFFGLQRQKHGPSVQQSLEEAIHGVTGEEVRAADEAAEEEAAQEAARAAQAGKKPEQTIQHSESEKRP